MRTRERQKATREVHEHAFVSEPREWIKFGKHSHDGGEIRHNHPGTGPGHYGYGQPRFTVRAIGQQAPYVERPPEDGFFDVYLTDSALYNDAVTGQLRPIQPDDDLDTLAGRPASDRYGLSAAERIAIRCRLTPRFHDLRTGR